MNNKSIYFKFNALIVGTILFCSIIMGSMLLMTISKNLEESLISSGQKIASSLAVSMSNDIMYDDRFAIWERLSKTLETNDQARYIIVTYPNGEVMLSTFGNNLPVGLPTNRQYDASKEIDYVLFSSSEGRIKEIMVPVDDGLIGYIRVGMSENEMMKILKVRCLETILAVLLLCGFAALMATRNARYFLKPIGRLVFGVKQLEKGNYGFKVPVYYKDEVGKLAITFNDMSDKLKTKIEENNRLVEQLKQKEQDRIWLINQLFDAREDEQRRISRELHDESSQSMASILTYLRVLHNILNTDEQREMLLEIRNMTATTLGGLRQLAVNLHPPLLDDLGLVVAIDKFLDPIDKMNPDIAIEFKHTGDFSVLSKPLSLICYRTIQEAVTNSLKHAEASRIDIELESDGATIILKVKDNGRGFSEDEAERARLNRHLGLVSMKERTEILNGSFEIKTGNDMGTCITVKLPIDIKDEGEIIDS